MDVDDQKHGGASTVEDDYEICKISRANDSNNYNITVNIGT